jgi:hypothetical protein
VKTIWVAVLFNRTSKIGLQGFGRVIALLFLQQLIVASSSLWLIKFILHISEGHSSLIWLWLYLTSLILPYLPGALALIEVAKAQVNTSVNYVQKFSKLYPGRIIEWSNHEKSSSKSSILAGEASPTITNYIEYLYHLASSALNIILNLLMLAFLITPSLLVSYWIGISFAFVILYVQKHPKKILALKAQQSRIKWISILIKAWDNILLKNQYNLDVWNYKESSRSKRLIGKAIYLEKFSQFISVVMAFALILPSILLISYLAVIHIQDVHFLAIIAVTLPRLFQVLTFSYECLFLLSDFPTHKAKLNTVMAIVDSQLQPENIAELLNRVNWEKIKAFQMHQENDLFEISSKELIQKLPNNGRVTLRGENGSGKTSLLLSIKMNNGGNAFYLPAKHDLLFKVSRGNVSTGQLVRKILEELLRSIETPIILLDEWDSNLDKKNREEMSSLIDALSIKHCVIETLHHKPN